MKGTAMQKVLLPLLVLVILSACDNRTPDQIYNAALDAKAQKKYDLALKEYERLANKFPEYEMVPKALYDVAELQMNQQNDLEAAIKAFQRLADQFTHSEEGLKARFMAGFLLANNVHRYEDAANEYHRFLTDYPNNSLIEAVRFELDNLGKPIEEIPTLKGLISPEKGEQSSELNIKIEK
jgi:outer membrane protein assembly factor BamD (BamD/ComL family)